MLRIRTKPHPTRPGVFVARVEGKFLCASRTPLADGARMLIKMGFPPSLLITMRHDGAEHDSFDPEPLANWAARAFVETPHGPKLIEWEPFPEARRPRAAVPSDRTDDSSENTQKHPDDPETSE